MTVQSGLIAAVIDGGDGKGPVAVQPTRAVPTESTVTVRLASHRSLMVPTSARASALVGLALQGRLSGFSRTAGKGGGLGYPESRCK